MNLRRSNFHAAALFFCIVPVAARAQEQPSPQAPPGVAQSQSASPQQAEPDYPDPRTFTFGIFDWVNAPETSPNLRGGKQATDFETLNGLGNGKMAPGVEVYFPITRTGELHVVYFRATGDGNQTASQALDLFTNPFAQGDYLATRYKIQSGKVYLDDLLYPYKFPAAKFRLKEMWEVEYLAINSTITAPLAATTDQNGNAISTSVEDSRRIILPEFGIAAEYAVAPHVLLRAEAAGFGLVHKADLWDAAGTISFRHNHWEVVAGAKAFHFKTSPNNTEYLTATMSGPFVGFRWHL